jgi:hypothetical protein
LRSAQRNRDDGLERARRITLWTGAGAALLTAAASLMAATTIPGHTQAQAADSAAATAQPAPDTGTGGTQGSQPVPAAPDQSLQQQPQIVSGGS